VAVHGCGDGDRITSRAPAIIFNWARVFLDFRREVPMPTRFWTAVWGAAVILTVTTAQPAGAQKPPAPLGPDSFLVVVPIRDTSAIHRDIAAAARARAQAGKDQLRAEGLKQSSHARIERKKVEIEGIERQQKVFKDQKRSAADIAALEADKKAAKQEKDLIERRESLRDAEIELEKKRAEMLDTRRQALELELQLANRRLDQQRAGNPGGPTGARMQQVLNDIEKRTLEAQQKEVDKSKEVADRQKEILQKRLQILEAQTKFAGS
jgi:hypothetical protein